MNGKGRGNTAGANARLASARSFGAAGLRARARFAFAPLALAVMAAASPDAAAAAEVVYADGAAPVVATANQVVDVLQQQTSAIEAIITGGAVTSNVSLGSAATSVTTNANTAAATVIANTSTSMLDLGLASGTGATSNAVIASALEMTGADAFARVTNTVVTTTVNDPVAGSSVSLSDNTLSAGTTLARATNTLQGEVNLGFGNTDGGLVDVTAAPAGSVTADSTAGLLLQSTQVSDDVQNATAGGTTAFSLVDGTSDIELTLDGGTDNALSNLAIDISDNTASASFTGNTADNLLDVQAGGLATLSSAAGISNVQVNDQVGLDNTGPTAITSAQVDQTVGIGATVAAGDSLSGSSLTMTGNTLSSSSTLSAAENDLVLADGISFAGPTTDPTAANVTLDATVAVETADVVADLFVSSAQVSVDSVSRAVTNAIDGIALTANTVTNSTVDSTANAITATAFGNSGASTLAVDGSTSFSGIVAGANLQSFGDATDDAVTANVSATVTNPAMTVSIAGAASETVSGSALAMDTNRIAATAVGNADALAVSVTGTGVTDGQTAADTNPAPGSELSLATEAATVAAGFSATNVQAVEGDATTGGPSVTASLTDATAASISMQIGNATGTVSDSSVSLSANTLSATANANEGGTSLTVDATNLDASSAVANLQMARGGASAVSTDADVELTVTSSGGDFDTLSVAADGNTISGAAAGNIGTNTLDVTAVAQTVTSAVVTADPTAARTALSLDGQTNTNPQAAAELSLLSTQGTTTVNGNETITSDVEDGAVLATVAAGANALTDVALSADGNAFTSTARANQAVNTLSADIGSLDLTGAVRDTGTTASVAGGTNLAALGSVQANFLAVTATLDDDGDANLSVSAEITSTSTVTGATVSADQNRRTAFAAGNQATNTLDLSGTSLVTTEGNAPAPELTVTGAQAAAVADTDILAENVAVAVGNEQANTGNITASVATGAGTGSDTIQARVTGDATVTNSSVSVDQNTVLAQARAATATTTASLDAATVRTSVVLGSAQANTGTVSATAGDADSVISILGGFSDGTQTNTSLTANSNVLGAEATALVDSSRLTVGGDGTASVLASGTLADGDAAADFDGTDLNAIADFAVVQRQTSTATVTADADSLLINLTAQDFTGGSIDADGNLLTGQATAISGATNLTVTASDLGASANAPVLAAMSGQENTGAVSGTLEDAGIVVGINSLDATAASESVSIDSNTLSASATGVTGANTLTAAAAAGAGSLTATNIDGAIDNTAGTILTEADRMLVSDQVNTGSITANVAATSGTANPRLEMTVTLAVDDDSLSMASNTIQGQARGLVGTNTLTNTAGAALEASAALASNQNGTAPVGSTVTEPRIVMTPTTTVDDSTLTVASNTFSATSIGVTGTNTLTSSAGSIDGAEPTPALSVTDTAGSEIVTNDSFASLTSVQRQSAAVTATIADDGSDVPATISVLPGDAVTASTIDVDSNTVEASATAVSATNRLVQASDTVQAAGSTANLASVQNADAGATSSLTGLDISLQAGGAATSSSLSVDANTAQVLATGTAATNTLDIDAGGAVTGDGTGGLGIAAGVLTGDMDYTLASNQTVGGTVAANINADTGGAAGDGPTIQLDVGANDFATGTTASVSSNTMRSQAIGATAINSGALNAGSLATAGAGVVSDQNVTAAITADIDSPAIEITGAAVTGNSTLDVSRNVLVAAGTAASATNSLTVDAATAVTGGGVGSTTLTAGGTPAFTDAQDPVATVLNTQVSTGAVTTDITGDATIGQPTIRAALTGGVVGTVDVDNNTVLAQSRGNVTTNTLALNAGSTLDNASQGILATTQSRSGGAITASATGTVGGADGTIGISAAGDVTGTLSVDNNTVRASGAANVALNAFAVDVGASIGTPAAGIGASAPAGGLTADAQFAALNAQTNASAVTVDVQDFQVALNTGANQFVGTASLNGNMAMADATGNSAVNTMTLAAGGNSFGTASALNYQTNSAALSATASNVTMALTTGATGGATGGAFAAVGNAIMATATGNSATTMLMGGGN